MSKIEVNTVAPQCGTTLTLGESGDTVTLGAGASQSGFGRTGTVDWITTPKTATFTAVSGEGYFCNTTSGSFTVNLPAGSAGAIVSVQDYNNTFDSNALTVDPNGSEKINGGAGSVNLTTEGEGLTLVYVDGTVGWRSIQDSAFSDVGATFITATGGTITTSGNCKIHTFTGPGTFTVSSLASCAANNLVSHMVVAGGGAGGMGNNTGGGGGAGGYREVKSPVTGCYTASPLNGYPSSPNRITVTATAFPITVGAGGAAVSGSPTSAVGNSGTNSVFSTITSAGGGGGGAYPGVGGANGGSGGGESNGSGAGSGNTPPVTPPQGNNGGPGAPPGLAMGGGGGASAVGGAGSAAPGGPGGNGTPSEISGAAVTRAGGGGGGGNNPGGTPDGGGSGGSGGGGTGGGTPTPGKTATDGTANTGGGGGGNGKAATDSGAGGSGIVVIRYKFQ